PGRPRSNPAKLKPSTPWRSCASRAPMLVNCVPENCTPVRCWAVDCLPEMALRVSCIPLGSTPPPCEPMMAVQFASRFCCPAVSVTPGVCSSLQTRSNACATLNCCGLMNPGTDVSGLLGLVALPGPVEMLMDTALPEVIEDPAAGAWLKIEL